MAHKSRITKPLLLLLLLLTALLLVQFADSEDSGGEARGSRSVDLPTRQTLRENFFANRQALFIYGAGDARFSDRYLQTIRNYQSRARRIDIEIKSDRDVLESDWQGKTVFLVGTLQSNRLLERLNDRLPVQFTPEGFAFAGKRYPEARDRITLLYPNPYDSRYALNLLGGNSDEALLKELEQSSGFIFGITGDYRIMRGEDCLVFGLFSQETTSRWQFDPASYRDFSAETVSALRTPNYNFHWHNLSGATGAAEETARRLDRAMENARKLLGITETLPPIDYHIYPNFEDKGLVTGNTDLSSADFSRYAVASVVCREIRGDDFSRDARLLLRRRYGEPRQQVLETGLSIYLCDAWRGKGYRYWAARLHLSGNGAPLSDLLDNELLVQESPLVMEPLAGTLVAYLVNRWGGIDSLLERYRQWSPDPAESELLASGWEAYLDSLAAEFAEDIRRDREAFPRSEDFQKGFCHAHEGYRIYNGYLSALSDQALARLASLGSNAVSITPFSYMGDPRRPNFLRHSRGAGSENDESIIHAALSAKALGMTVMLKPHIWLGRSWPGEIEMQNEQDWEAFFQYYYRWMRHYALLGEMYEVENLCVGVELVRATVGQEARWRELIARLRGLYSGKITYAANWGSEFEKVRFWDALDYIGLNCYYPLSEKDNPSDADLQAGAARIAETIEAVQQRYRKPVLLTEIGFTSTAAPWKQPHEVAGGRPVDTSSQARCYEAVLSELHGKSWLRGIYWWKWPTYLDYGGAANNDFTPNGKLAEEVVARWYGEKW